MPTDKQALLTTGQAARLCSVTPDAILKWIKKGRLAGIRTAGGHYRIERSALEPLVASRSAAGTPPQMPHAHSENMRCWEYLSDGGIVRDDCRQCVVYRVRAARCFMMAGMEQELGHARQFCETTCEDCVYYRRMKGLATNVLVISADEKLIERFPDDEQQRFSYRFARNAYEASAIIPDFRPAFVVVDTTNIRAGDSELLDSLTNDLRLPGLRIIIAAPPNAKGRKRPWQRCDAVVSILEKPIDGRDIAAVIDSLQVVSLHRNGNPQATARKERP